MGKLRGPLNKNDIIDLEILDITREGNGVGRSRDMAVFVPDTAVGDLIRCRIVKVLKSYCFGRVEEVLVPSPSRITPDCPVSRQCGGCCFRHISYEEECRLKDKFVRDAFTRIGKLEPEFLPFKACDETDHYRNKAQFPVAQADGRAICGFYARRSHRVIENYDCRLQPEVFGDIVRLVIGLVNELGIPAYDEVALTGSLRHIYLRRGYHSGEIMVCFVVTDLAMSDKYERIAQELVKSFPDIKTVLLNENPRNTNVILGDKLKVIYGEGHITDVMCSNTVELSPHSFYQVNTAQAERLYGAAQEQAGLSQDDVLLDLYCGIGTIGLSMARDVKQVIGVEVIPQAIENAKANALRNGLDNTEFLCGDAGTVAEELYRRGLRPDVIIADPARKGCDRNSLEQMVRMAPQRIVMVSCDPATAARDCGLLREMGYETVNVRGVDMFPRTGHVECVALLTRA